MSATAAALVGIATELGVPIIASILRRRGGRAGQIASTTIEAVAQQLGTEATADAIVARYEADPENTRAAFQKVESGMEELATAASEATQSYHELLAGDRDSQSLLNRLWRPVNGFLFGAEVFAIVLTVVVVIWRGEVDTIRALQELWSFLGTILGAHAGVVGVYVWRRSDEKLGRVQ